MPALGTPARQLLPDSQRRLLRSNPSTTLRPLSELAEEAAQRLTSEELYAIASRVAVYELRDSEPQPKTDLATTIAFSGIDPAVRHLLDLWGPEGVGLDPDLAAAHVILPALLHAGIDETAATAAVERVTGWRPRTEEERWRSVAAGMIHDGYPADVVRNAIAEVADAELGGWQHECARR